MATTITLAPGEVFTIINPTTIDYAGTLYTDVTSLTFGGETKTLGEIIEEHGGPVYSESELRQTVKVELVDPDANGRQIATIYSTNSRNVGKNATASIPGGAWVEMFNFRGDADNNHVLQMWKAYFDAIGVDYLTQFEPEWLGFKINYSVNDAHSYVVTWVDQFGQESQPCPPAEHGVPYMYDIKATGRFQRPTYITDAQGTRHYFAPIKNFRLYRSNVTQAGQVSYQRVPLEPTSIAPNVIVGAFPAAIQDDLIHGFQFIDTVEHVDLLDVLPSIDWSPPPYRAMKGLTPWRNGMMAAFNGNTVMFCEPYRPFAWPTRYYVALPHEVVAMEIDQNSLVVVTTGEAYVFAGSHPANVQYERLEEQQAALRADEIAAGSRPPSRAVVATPAGVLYATAEGPVLISGGRGIPLGRALFTRKEWAGRYQGFFGVMRLAYFDGRVLAYFADAQIGGFLLSMADGGSQLVTYSPTDRVLGNFNHPRDDSLHILSRGTTTTAARFADEQTPPVTATYWTREIHLPRPENLGAIEVRGLGGLVQVEVFQDGVNTPNFIKTWTLGGSMTRATAKLPSHRKATNYSVRVTTTGYAVVRELYLASTMRELANA